MSALYKIKSARSLYSNGYLSFPDMVNISANQVIFWLVEKYYNARDFFYGDWRCVWNYRKDLPQGTLAKKRALVSFLRYPIFKRHFIGRIRYFFSTNGLLLGWLKVLNSLGYECDVIDLYNRDFLVKRQYDVVIFHGGQNFRALSKQLPEKTLKISFETGAHWQTHNSKEQERFNYLEKRKALALPLDRKVRDEQQAEEVFRAADAIVVLGGKFTAGTYGQYKNIYHLPNGFYADEYFINKGPSFKKDFTQAKKSFLFYSGGGNIHKGLDLVIEAFAQTDLHLYICTYLEPAVAELYKKELSLANIHVIGYLPQRSKGFYRLIQQCAFNIHPSCAEGSPGGVIDLLQYGIIPIVSMESHIDLPDPVVVLKQNTVEEILVTIKNLSQQDVRTLQTSADSLRQMAFASFSEKNYHQNLSAILKEVL